METKQTPQPPGDGKSQLTVDAAFAKAVEHFNAARYSEADQICSTIIQASPNHINALNLLGVTAQRVNRHDLAVGLFKRAIDINGDIAVLHQNLGLSFHALGQRDEAIEALQRALKKEPDNSQIAGYLNTVLNTGFDNLELNSEEALHRGISCHQSARFNEALQWYKKSIAINPKNAVALSNMGAILRNQGELAEAVVSYQKAITIKPDFADAYSNLGNTLKDQGKLDEAVASIQKAIAINPGSAEFYYNLGTALQEQDKQEEAVANFQKAITIKPEFAEAYSNLGNSLKKQGKLDEAIISYNKSIIIKPDAADTHNNLGIALQEQERVDEAVISFQKALSINAGYADAHYNLGTVLKEQGRLDESAACFKQAIAIQPDYTNAYNNLGVILKEQSRFDESVACFKQAISIQPDNAQAHNNLGTSLQCQEKLTEAVASFQKAVELDPGFAEFYANLASALYEQGRVEEAVSQIDIALSLQPDRYGWLIKKTLLLPMITNSVEDLQRCRKKLIDGVHALLNRDISVENPPSDVGIANFYLAYHNQNNREILKDITKLHVKACPELAYEAEHCKSKNLAKKSRLRIGFLSAFLNHHTVAEHFRGIIEHFSREKFEVIVIHAPGKRDDLSETIDGTADRVLFLNGRLKDDWKIIEREKFDILFYLDIGMDPYTYFLSFSRLAPVQAVSIGHAETSGAYNIDYFLSSKMSEIDGAEEHYSEQLIELSLLPVYYYRPKIPAKVFKRSDFSLPDGVRLYVYPHSLFKMHPGFDQTLGKLLRNDPDGRLILIADGDGQLSNFVMERLKRTITDVAKNVIFVPRLDFDKFLGLTMLADALLDNPYISGTSAGLVSLGIGAPIVAWPGKLCTCRAITACYKQMEMDDLVATDEESFLQLTWRVANDQEFKARLQEKIRANSHKLYERIEVVREMEEFFIKAYELSQEGKILTKL
ncbi:MAG: tetratricopeptide repeat protein [Magnetococcales bacterium]|nr:tetratricopeptide repeat protein [Magnetococcales bacterium]